MAERIEADRKRIDAEWIDAFGEETGYQLMTLLRKEPRLLTIKYCGCNVLHLAMRHNWYSLVLEILRKFKHLYKDASFLYRGFSSRSEVENHREDTEDFRSSSTVDSQATTGDLHSKDVYGLDLASFRDLLEAKEDGGETSSRGKVTKWKYESGLDVFAMAVIQGDAAINTLLAEAVLQVNGLFDHPHPYKDVFLFIRERVKEWGGTDERIFRFFSSPDGHGKEPEETGETNSSPDRHHKEEKKQLCEAIDDCFLDFDRLSVMISERTHAASNVSTGEQTYSRSTSSSSFSLLDLLERQETRHFPATTSATSLFDGLLETYGDRIYAASNVCTSEQQRVTLSELASVMTAGEMQDDRRFVHLRQMIEHADSGSSLQDKIDPQWTQEWELTSPYLPLEEFIFLACFSLRNRKTLEEKRIQIQESVLRAFRTKRFSFRKYLFRIKDTRGSVLHHMIRGGVSDQIWEMMSIHALADSTNERDSVGRTPLYIALALGDTNKVKRLLKIEERRVEDHLESTIDNLKSTLWKENEKTSREETLQFQECVRWRFKGDWLPVKFTGFSLRFKGEKMTGYWLANVGVVSTVNLAWQADLVSPSNRATRRARTGWELWRTSQGVDCLDHNRKRVRIFKVNMNAPQVIIRSPHLSDEDRLLLTRVCTMREDYTPHYCHRPPGEITWLELAAYLCDSPTLEMLAKDDKVYDISRLSNLSFMPSDWYSVYSSVLHAAAMAGHPDMIRIILATGKFDPLVQDHNGNTALHLASHFQATLQFPYSLTDRCEIPDVCIGNSHQGGSSLSTEERKSLVKVKESRKQGCINLLLQAGIDVWQTNHDGEIADPGPNASSEYSTWWYDKVSKETQEARTSLNAAANAISVTAALVATASYGGPLQPPLGYAAQSEGLIDKMQVGVLSVRIFIVCNTLAFYLALAAIMLSLTPSLPMPQESILDELKLIRRTVTWAVGLLIMSIVSILMAFASASIAVIPDEGSWNHGGLTITTLSIGGFICLLVLVLCLFRLLRLAFHNRNDVRRFYRKYVCM